MKKTKQETNKIQSLVACIELSTVVQIKLELAMNMCEL